MLTELRIKKYLFLKNVELDLSPGLNVFTGETGVGKSLALSSIQFVLGKKGDYPDGTSVELVFEGVNNEFSEEGLLVLARQIKNGKSQYFINGRRTTLSNIKKASEGLIEINSQHSQQALFSKNYHRQVLDSFANLEDLLAEYRKLYTEYTNLKNQYEELREQSSNRLKEIDIIKFQLQELEEAQLETGKKEKFEERFEYLSSLEEIKSTVEEAKYILVDKDQGVEEEISYIINRLSNWESVKEIKNTLEMLQEAKSLIKEAYYEILSLDFETNPDELSQIQEYLNRVNHLELKYNLDEQGLINLKEELKERLNHLENLDFELPQLERKLSQLEERLQEEAVYISRIRKQKARELEKLVKSNLEDLALKDAKFAVSFKEKPLSADGIDDVEFLFSANKGFEPQPISKVASGGELSRISLALKIVSQKSTDTVVFDEIDTGIGGKTAFKLAKKLKELSKNFQILLVSHLPQVAVLADRHFLVEKQTINDETVAKVYCIGDAQRDREIARMLGGIVNDTTITLAKQLVNQIDEV